MKAVKPVLAALSLLCMTTVLSGCATIQARVERGGTFTTAGIAYVDAIPAVLDESFALTVAANSHQLLLSRGDLTEEERAEELGKSNALLHERQQLLQNLRRHSLLLRSYFLALQALTADDKASGINSATEGVVTRLAELRPGIEDKTIGDAKITDLIGPGIKLVVGAYQNAALKQELAARGEAIERELALQQEAINALIDDMTDNAQLIIQIEELNPIFIEYVSAKRVSKTWNDKRLSAFKRTVSMESHDDIRNAAASMHSTWIALVEKRDTEATINLLIEDVERFSAVARLFKSND